MTELRNYHRLLTWRRWKEQRSQHSLYCEQEGITVSDFSAGLKHELDQVVDEESLSGGGEDSEHDEEEDADEEGNIESTGMKQKKQRTGRSTPQKLR